MTLTNIDLLIIVLVLLFALMTGLYASKQAGKNTSEFFLSGRNMPWWLLGFSMVATTFSTDTPNLVTDIVRQNGVSGNWVWWAFLLTGMLTVFVYARLWRKSGVTTDMEFYELRYSGKGASFLRGFRAVYLGLIFNILAMSGVILAAIKIGEVMFQWTPWQTISVSTIVTLIFSVLGGLRGVVLTDFVLFIISMIGAVGAAIVAIQLPEVGGLAAMLSHEDVKSSLSLIPDFDNKSIFITAFIIPLSVQWWSAWYPGAEPGGGGYIAQRMLAAKNEKHSVGATFFFNIAHYALRPWPWILVALASIIVYPDLESIKEAFPNVSDDKLGHDLAYPAMLTLLPSGLLGLVIASLSAAFMSTISTHLNWGSSYLVNDFYKRFIDPGASEKRLVFVGRLSTVVLMLLSALFALELTNAKKLFDIIIMFGAGTGLLFILRWFWWRINAWSEISAMFVSGIVAYLMAESSVFDFIHDDWKFPFSVLITTVVWLTVTLLTNPTKTSRLIDFCTLTNPGGPGWKTIYEAARKSGKEIPIKAKWFVPDGIKAMLLGCVLVYSILFGTGYLLYGHFILGGGLIVCSMILIVILTRQIRDMEIL